MMIINDYISIQRLNNYEEPGTNIRIYKSSWKTIIWKRKCKIFLKRVLGL